ncbi:VTT domain-containing protein [Flammeovirga sp. MY04]|uniref:TVP38/TMEM64 family protein n=1 Tax=Flammeovirga sp. MY04 TaxID=1191459 RepID=UPI0008062EE0|nr:VTT domain-containing protein [Flammeovirga sp. MY04]ANQ51944.1 VTT domain-containing protein [Flammeovirga sp. MY04]
MKKLITLTFSLITFFLVSFGIVVAFKIPILEDPTPLFELDVVQMKIASITLLSLDIILPIPGSLIMIGNGTYFGWFEGTILSVIGGMISTFIGFYLGKQPQLIQRFLSDKEKNKASELIQKWGILIVAVSRPIPLLSESICIMAGCSNISNSKMFFYSFLGYLPGAFIYAYSGELLQYDDQLGSISFIIVLGISVIFWGIGKLFKSSKWGKENTSVS